jgi:ABC-2 type transport system permease protein
MTAAATAQRTARRRPRTISVIATICRDDLRHLTRDRTALILMLVMPILVMLIVGATFGSVPNKVPVGLVDLDGSRGAAQVRRALEDTPAVAVHAYADEAEMRREVRTRSLDGGVVIPAGFGARLDAGEPVDLTMAVDLTQTNSQSLLTIVQSAVTREGTVIAAGRFARDHTGADQGEAIERARALAAQVPAVPVTVEALTVETSTANRSPNATNPYAYTGISNLVLFVFVSTLAGGSALVERRQLGVTRRMLAGPVTTRAIVAGTAASRLMVALLQSAAILIVGRVLFDVHWGDPLGVALVLTTFAALATAVSLLVGSIVNTPNQIQSVGIPVAIALGMLGGCMWPLEIVPEPMQVIGHLTPHAWAMDAWIQLAFAEATAVDVLPQVGVLAAIAAVLAVVSGFALRRSLTRG